MLHSSNTAQVPYSKLTLLLASLALTVTFGIFGPLELFLTNANEFWFSLGHIGWPVSLVACILFGSLFTLGAVLPVKWRTPYANLLFGVALGLYLQGNWINVDYGVLDGRTIKWDQYTGVAVLNTIIWLACLISPFALSSLTFWTRAINYAALSIIAVQLSTLGILLVTTPVDKADADVYPSLHGEFNLSTNRNIIVFVLDAFDSRYFQELLRSYPELKDSFRDFTYYPDTVAAAARTKAAMPAILTGVPYVVPLPYYEYIDYAYGRTELYRTLHKRSYEIGLYSALYVAPSQRELLDNLVDGTSEVSSYSLLTKYLYQLTAFKYMPHLLKHKFWLYSGIFSELQTARSTERCSSNSVAFYQRLLQNRLSTRDTEGAFRFYYLDGAHPPYYMDEFARRVSPDETNQLMQAKGSLLIVQEYIKQLRERNVYDNTSLIVTADHGDIGLGQNPLLMVKLAGKSNGFEISNVPVSLFDLHPMLLKIISGNYDLFDYEEGDERIRHFYRDTSRNSVTSIVEYAINGLAWDDGSISPTGKVYSGDTDDNQEYRIGTELTFGPDGTATPYFIEGFSRTDAGPYNWTDGKSAQMKFTLDKVPAGDLRVNIYTMVYTRVGPQRMIIKSGNQVVHVGTYEKTSRIEFVVPRQLINDKTVILEFEFPDAVRPYDYFGSGNDSRILGFAFLGLTMSEGKLDTSTRRTG